MAQMVSLVVACSLLVGCAPARFEKVTSSFAASVSGMASAMNTSLTGLAQDEAANRNQVLLSRRVAPRLSPACLATSAIGPKGERLPACGLVSTASGIPAQEIVWSQRAGALRILDALNTYAEGLQALTSAETRKQTDEATDAIAAGLGSAVTFANYSGLAAPIAAAVKLGGFVYAETQDARRYRKLRRSVAEGEKALQVVGPVLRDAFIAISDARIGLGMDTGNKMAQAVNPRSGDYALAFARVAKQASQIEAIQRADAGGVVTEMLNAHAALGKALEENKGETVAVFQAMTGLETRVTALRTAVEQAKKD